MNIIISSPLRPDKKQIRGSAFAICRTEYTFIILSKREKEKEKKNEYGFTRIYVKGHNWASDILWEKFFSLGS